MVDENGNIFMIFKQKETEEKLNLSDKTVTKAFKQLADLNLIYEKWQGCKKNNIISWFTILVIRLPFGLWFEMQSYPPHSLYYQVSVRRLKNFATLGGKHLWLDLHQQD